MRFGPTLKEQGLVHLQGIGDCEGVPVEDIQPGDRLVWNYGSESQVVAVEWSKTHKTAIFVTRSRDGKEYQRKVHAGRLVVRADSKNCIKVAR